MRTPPPQSVLAAFNASGEAHLLDGGQGETWRAGTAVLKPAGTAVESRWRASVLDALPETDQVRIARPLRALSGDWVHEGWEAWHHCAGETDPTRWDTAVQAGAAFHELLSDVPRPDFLDDRENWWSTGDRLSWDLTAEAEAPLVQRLMEARQSVPVEEQMVHGDLLGNVLYEPGLPPAIIDWAPYWRPTSWASAVAVVDALCWHGAGEGAVERWAHLPHWPQMLVRGLLYRMITDQQIAQSQGQDWQPHPTYGPVAQLILARV